MNQVPVKLGPLALLLTVISICLTTLAILTFSTARADWRLADRYAQTVTARYDLMNEGQAANLELLSRFISFYICVLLCGLIVLTTYLIIRFRRER